MSNEKQDQTAHQQQAQPTELTPYTVKKTGLTARGKSLDAVLSIQFSKEISPSANQILSLIKNEMTEFLPVVVSKIQDEFIAVPGKGTQISKFKKEAGDLEVRKLIASLIYDLQDAFNVVRPLTDPQVRSIVEVIISDYWHLKVEQIARAFYIQKTQQIVRVLDRLDMGIILEVLRYYENEIAMPVTLSNVNKHKEYIEPRVRATGGDDPNFREIVVQQTKKEIINNNKK